TDILKSDDISLVLNILKNDILSKIDRFMSNGSGWTIHKITKHMLFINKSQPLRGESYIKLPDWIQNRKATVNIQNKNDKCFIYCLGRALEHTYQNPEKNDLQRVSKHLEEVCDKLGLNTIKTQVQIDSDLVKIEDNFNITINVYGHNKFGIFVIQT